jgi:hypothetical protein
MRWAVPLANRFFIGFTQKTRNGFQHTITEISEQLDTNAYLTPRPLPKHPRRRR